MFIRKYRSECFAQNLATALNHDHWAILDLKPRWSEKLLNAFCETHYFKFLLK